MNGKGIAAAALLTLMAGIVWPAAGYAAPAALQERIDRAHAGDTLTIPQGIYRGDLHIGKPLTLVGKGTVTIVGSGTDSVVTVTSPGVALEHLSIRHSGAVLERDQAAVLLESDHNRLSDLRISDALHGIYLRNSSDNIIENCTVSGKPELDRSRRGNGIHLFHSDNNRIRDNVISMTRDGIYFSFSGDNDISGNNVFRTRYGLHYMYSNNNRFTDNRFHDNVGGAAIMFSHGIAMTGNQFYNHRSMQGFGILFQASDDNRLTGNKFVMNQRGIFADQSNRNAFRNNDFVDNRIGAEIWSSSDGNVLSGNRFIGNAIPFSSDGGADHSVWSQNGRGNAWSDDAWIDLDRDGVGDDPYIYRDSFGSLFAREPLGALFLDSPSLSLFKQLQGLGSMSGTEMKDPFPLPVDPSPGKALPAALVLIALAGMWLLGRGRQRWR